jgi:hypothetical protein
MLHLEVSLGLPRYDSAALDGYDGFSDWLIEPASSAEYA